MKPDETIAESLQTLWRAMSHGVEGLSPALHALLHRLAREGPQGVTTLARQLGVLPSSITVASQRLERMGLVERRREPQDERRVVLALTAAGQEELAASRRRKAERLQRAISTLTARQQEQLARLLHTLAEALHAQSAEAPAAPPRSERGRGADPGHPG